MDLSTPYLEENDFERRLIIPLHEITYDDFASFSNIPRDSPTYLYLIQFWRRSAGTISTEARYLVTEYLKL
ncbi:MAG: hypothetical protein ACXV4C_10390 [Halobacteriota archaeon]